MFRNATEPTATTEVFEHNFCCERDRFQLKYVPLRITDSRAEHAPLIKAKLTEIVGAKLYASRHSQLFAASATREELAARSGTLWEGSQGTYFHPDWLFHPLTIMRADYDEASDSLFFELKMPNGTVALAATSYVDEGPRSSFLESVEGSLFAQIPTSFSPLDVRSLQQSKLVRGVSFDVVHELYGPEDSSNHWGAAETQLVYFHGRFLIYLDQNDRVRDWQSLDF